MQFQDREKNILAGVAVLVILCLYFYWSKPIVDKHAENHKTIISLKQELKRPEKTQEDLELLEKQILELGDDISGLKYQLPKSERRGFLIRDLESLARENDIELLNFMPKEAIPVSSTGKEITRSLRKKLIKNQQLDAAKGKVLKTIINIDSKGKFKDYNKFFRDINTYYRAVEVADVTMSRVGASASGKVDKRFGGGRRKKDSLQQRLSQQLNVAFTLYAYTDI